MASSSVRYCADRPLGLPVGPGVTGVGQPVLDALPAADPVEVVRTTSGCVRSEKRWSARLGRTS